MPRSKDLRRFFWEQVANALHLQDKQISEKGWGVDHQIVLSGILNGFSVEAGTYSEGSGQSSVAYTFASVVVHDLPPRLQIDGLHAMGTPAGVHVSCNGDRVRTVTVQSVPVDFGELRLEQVSVDLDEFLTPARRRAICSLTSDLHWVEGHHQVRAKTRDHPYPRKRTLAAAVAGDPEGAQTTSESRDAVVALVQTAVRDAETVADELRIDHDEYEND